MGSSRRPHKAKYAALVLLIATSTVQAAWVHVHPVPSLPRDFDPATATDVFSISVISQIHQSLFRIDSNSVPLPQLVDSFAVSPDQLEYSFELRGVRFHDGTPLTAEDAKYSLERAIAKKVPGYEWLRLIAGFPAFAARKTAHLSGLECQTRRRLVIRLTEPFPALVERLADVRFSILKKGARSTSVGLGPYRLKEGPRDAVVLERRPQAAGGPGIVRYVRASQSQAIRDFQTERAQDLFAYSLKRTDVERVGGKAVTQVIQGPRTYVLAANPRLIPQLSERDLVLASIDRDALVRSCYSEQAPTGSVIPPGFPGYLNDALAPTVSRPARQAGPFIDHLRVVIALGVDAEACVKARLSADLASVARRVSIQVVDTDAAVAAWQKDVAEVFFAYLEAENTLDMFQLFNPSASFTFGAPGDRSMTARFAAYQGADNPTEVHRQAENLSRHILSLRTVLPLFHPKQFIVYSSKYKPMKLGVRSSTFIDFSSLVESQ